MSSYHHHQQRTKSSMLYITITLIAINLCHQKQSIAFANAEDHSQTYLSQYKYMHQEYDVKQTNMVQSLKKRRVLNDEIVDIIAKHEELHGGRILHHHYTDVHQLNQDGFTGGHAKGITDSRLPSLRDKPFDGNDFQMLQNLAPLLPGEENPWPYETNPYWKYDACYDINVRSNTNPNVTIIASSFGRECSEDLGAGRSIPWCPIYDSVESFYQIKITHGPTRIESIRTKGTKEGFISSFIILTSMHPLDTEFFIYTERDEVVIFKQDNFTDTTHMLHNTTLRFIRLIPLTWVGKIRLQIELHKCWLCGDGFWDQADEECDDGGRLDLDGCSGYKSHQYGLPRGCMKETDNGRNWCEDGSDGSNRGNVLDDCVRRRRVVEPGQTRHNAQAHYEARGHISSGGFNSGILPLCDGESCDGQDPFG